jgi:uncharacterized protein YjbI with pentapeptide repeats
MSLRRIWKLFWALPITPRRIWKGILEFARITGIIAIVAGIITLVIFYEAYLFGTALKTPKDFVKALGESGILGAVESVAIISGVVLFLVSGARDQIKTARLEAWRVLDLANGKETSYARIQALTDLNENSVSLEGLDAPHADLNYINLEGANLSRATLTKTQFQQAKLQQACFASAIIHECNFSFSDLRRAEFYNSKAKGANFCRARLRKASFQQAELDGSDFRSANLEGADFRGATLTRCILESANIAGANFQGASLPRLEEIKKAEHWQTATYDVGIHQQIAQLP